VEADEDTDPEVGGDTGIGPEASSVVKPRRKIRAAVVKQSVSTAVAKVIAVKVVEKKRKRKTRPPLAVRTPVIPTPLTKEVNSDDELEEDDDDEATDEPPIVEERAVSVGHTPRVPMQGRMKTDSY
jgi:hypothetical protein